MQATIYETITNQIVQAIETGAANYCMPWHRSWHDIAGPSNIESGQAYRGINTLALWATAEARGYGSGQWATYRQWQTQGAQVRKGEKAAAIVFWKDLRGTDGGAVEAAHEPEQRRVFVARGYAVFNADQVDGWTPPAVPHLPECERIEAAERFFAAIPALIVRAATRPVTCPQPTRSEYRPLDSSAARSIMRRPSRTSWPTGLARSRASTATSRGGSAPRPMRWRSWSPSWARPSIAACSVSPLRAGALACTILARRRLSSSTRDTVATWWDSTDLFPLCP